LPQIYTDGADGVGDGRTAPICIGLVVAVDLQVCPIHWGASLAGLKPCSYPLRFRQVIEDRHIATPTGG
jgi:hypothetical protein